MSDQCGCELGDVCTKTTVCANEMVIEDLQEEIERLTVEIKHAKEMERVWKANAKALADVANKAEGRADVMVAALLEIVDDDSLNAKWYANKALGKYDE